MPASRWSSPGRRTLLELLVHLLERGQPEGAAGRRKQLALAGACWAGLLPVLAAALRRPQADVR